MKLSRRGAMAAGIGGLLGGKEVAKSMMDQPLKSTGILGKIRRGEDAGEGDINTPQMMENKISDHIAYLKKRAMGEFDEWQESNLNNYAGLRQEKLAHEIDSFKSMSNSAKLIMADRLRKKATRQQWIDDAKMELANYAKRSIFGGG